MYRYTTNRRVAIQPPKAETHKVTYTKKNAKRITAWKVADRRKNWHSPSNTGTANAV